MMSRLSRLTVSLVQSIMTKMAPLYMWFVTGCLALIYDRSATHVPPTNNRILLCTAVQLAKAIRLRQLTAVAVMEAYITRVKEVNPITNAVVADRFDAALREARHVDEILSSDTIADKYSEANMPFLGVPTSIKECFSVEGCKATSGLVARKDCISPVDAPVVAYMKAAGFIPFVFTNVSELCMWYETSNYLFGTTRNAYDTSRIVGGSSGGEACNLSAGGAVVGLGSDIGGSIRMPAFFNGVFGHKPSYGIVDNKGQHPALESSDDSILCTGPICRYASDLKPMLKVMAGPSISKLTLDEEVDFKKMQFFTMPDMGGGLLVSNVDPELKDAQKRVGQYFEHEFGSRVNLVNINDMEYLLEIWAAEMHAAGGKTFTHYMANEQGEVNPYVEFVKWLFRISNHTLPAIALGIMEGFSNRSHEVHKRFLRKSKHLRQQLVSLLSNDSVFLFPSHPRICPYHNEPLFHPFDFPYTAGFNALRLPVTQCPVGLSKSGHPMGIQVVAAPFHDHLTLAVACEIERGMGGWVMPGQ